MDKIETLLTGSPQRGFELATRISSMMMEVVQPSDEIRDRLLAIYEDDAESVLSACHVIAVNFQTIAAANNYWRGKDAG